MLRRIHVDVNPALKERVIQKRRSTQCREDVTSGSGRKTIRVLSSLWSGSRKITESQLPRQTTFIDHIHR